MLAIDLDLSAVGHVKRKIARAGLNNVILAHGNFKNLRKIVERHRSAFIGRAEERREEEAEYSHPFSGIIFDLGLSSAQLEDRNRGFSFQLDAPIDMSFGREENADEGEHESTADIVNGWSGEKLEHIFRFYGEERYARRIAQAIVGARKRAPIKRTGQLVRIILGAVPPVYRKIKLHPATRTFQALRIATNGELENLEAALPQAVDLLSPGGRMAVISYHSLEDRIVKNFMKKESRDCLCPPEVPVCLCGHKAGIKAVTRRVVIPGDDEIGRNPRSRSAKLRVAEKL